MKNDELYTDRLVLRKAKESDLEFIYKNVWSDARLTKYMLWQVNNSIDEARDRLNRTIAYQKDHYAYFICLKETDEAIGFAGVIDIGEGAFEDTGLCVATDYQAKGLGKEVVTALANLIFNELNGKRFVYSCFSENNHSKKLALSLGFKYIKSEDKVRDYDKYEYVSNVYYLDKGEII